MPGTKEIRNHMESVRDTKKITGAMYLIASAKQRTAKEELDKTRPYFNALRAEIKRVFRTVSDVRSVYFFPPDTEDIENGEYAVLVITADKGLAGAYNQNVIREAMRIVDTHDRTRLYVIGEYGRQYCMSHHIPFVESFRYTAREPTLHRARKISRELLEAYTAGQIRKLFVVYTDLGGVGASERALSTRLLPFHRRQFSDREEAPVGTPFEFLSSVESVLDAIIPSYVTGFIYSALVDSFCCEQSARMSAMRAANDNADELLETLQKEYNHVRQAAITKEITETAAGAKAQNERRTSSAD